MRCTINWYVDENIVRHKIIKCQVFSGSTVGSLVDMIRSHWDVDINASRIVEGQVRFIDYLVKEMPSGALLLSEYPAALLFPDKNSNTANIEVTFIFERVVKQCCSKRVATWGVFSAFVVVRPLAKALACLPFLHPFCFDVHLSFSSSSYLFLFLFYFFRLFLLCLSSF